ncbi:hypothetical protein G9A89_019394 [Geosiphon pyriformis]|nr:hypothetical protein G9A89_019394 [Geosiphon pyriformis]
MTVGFESKNTMESVYYTELIFGDVKLSWARLDLVHCKRCGFLGYSALKCGAPLVSTFKSSKVARKTTSKEHHLQLAKLYVKKTVSISHPATFGDKSWAQVMLLNSSSNGSLFCMVSSMFFGGGLFPNARIFSVISVLSSDSVLCNYLSSLECFLELLADQVSNILKKLSYIELVLLASSLFVPPFIASISLVVDMNSDMTLNDALIDLIFLPVVVIDAVADISLSSSKVLTTKARGLESKMVALKMLVESVLERLDQLCSGLDFELVWKFATCNIRGINVSVKQEDIVCWHKESGNMVSIVTETKLRSNIRSWIMNKFDEVQIFTSGLGVSFFGAGVAIIMNSFLARHVSKVDKISGWLISVHFLFKNKLSVTILNLYAGASVNIHFNQAFFINSLISRVANFSLFIVVGDNFNENGSKKSANFKFCSDLNLVNIFNRHSLAKAPIWSNSKGVEKMLDFIFVSENLVSIVTLHKVNNMLKFFDTDYKIISVMVDLGELLNACLNSARKQTNQDQ